MKDTRDFDSKSFRKNIVETKSRPKISADLIKIKFEDTHQTTNELT